jgi:hypothetical protein
MDFIARLLGRGKKDNNSDGGAGSISNSNANSTSAAVGSAVASHEEALQQQQLSGDATINANGAAPGVSSSHSRSGKIPDGLHLSGAAALSASSTAAASASTATPAASSAPAASPSSSSSSSTPSSSAATNNVPTPAGAAPAPKKSLPNVSSCCPAEKLHYERCFQQWYTNEYLTGKSRDLSGCQTLFDTYRSCVIVSRPTPPYARASQPNSKHSSQD